jgi:hypothetical protein
MRVLPPPAQYTVSLMDRIGRYKIVRELGRGATHTPCSFVSGPVPCTGRSVVCSPALSTSRESPASRCSSSRSGFGMTARPALSVVGRLFIRTKVWVEPSVHAIPARQGVQRPSPSLLGVLCAFFASSRGIRSQPQPNKLTPLLNHLQTLCPNPSNPVQYPISEVGSYAPAQPKWKKPILPA